MEHMKNITTSTSTTASNLPIPILPSSSTTTTRTSSLRQISTKKPRAPPKKKNSRIGCKQCKDRKIKCDESLPQCHNCHVRVSDQRCSYLDFSEEDVVYFLERKKENERIKQLHQLKLAEIAAKAAGEQQESTKTSSSPVSFSCTSSPDSTGLIGPFHIPLIKHSMPPPYYASQAISFLQEPPDVVQIRLYLIRLLTASYFRFNESFKSHLCLASFWIHRQLKKRYESQINYQNNEEEEEEEIENKELESLHLLGMKKLHTSLQHIKGKVDTLIKAQGKQQHNLALWIYSEMVISTYCLEICDLIKEDNLRVYYFEGFFMILNEFLKDGDGNVSTVGNYAAQSSYSYIQQSLYTPNYPPDVLFEVVQVLTEFKNIVLSRDGNDWMLLGDIDRLIQYIQVDLLTFLMNKNEQDPDFILTYPPQRLYNALHKFYGLFPSKACVIGTINNDLHKTYYSCYYAIARLLDNVLPTTRYLAQFRFIGPSTLYPFSFEDLREGLDDELLSIANYFLRLLTFFHRRAHFFVHNMRIKTPFPESLKVGNNRFRSRRIVVQEVYITKFRETLIKPEHYPRAVASEGPLQYHVKGSRNNSATELDDSAGGDQLGNINNIGEFSSDFKAIFSSNLSFGDVDFSQMELSPDYNNNTPTNFLDNIKRYKESDSGLFSNDYDPLGYEWINDNVHTPQVGTEELNLYIADRWILMKEFVMRQNWFTETS